VSEPGDFTAKAEQLIADAAALPSAEQVRALADRAVAHGGTQSMSVEEIRALAARRSTPPTSSPSSSGAWSSFSRLPGSRRGVNCERRRDPGCGQQRGTAHGLAPRQRGRPATKAQQEAAAKFMVLVGDTFAPETAQKRTH
jgi:hypothetical protein